eukprot:s220_g22.t1
MGKPTKRSGPSVEALQQLAKDLLEKKKAEQGEASASVPVPADVPPTVPESSKRRRVTGKTPPSVATEDPPKAPEVPEPKPKKERKPSLAKKIKQVEKHFDPSNLPFELSWANFGLLKSHFDLKDDETTSILVAVLGPCEEGKRYWEQFKIPKSLFDKPAPDFTEAADEEDAAVSKDASKEPVNKEPVDKKQPVTPKQPTSKDSKASVNLKEKVKDPSNLKVKEPRHLKEPNNLNKPTKEPAKEPVKEPAQEPVHKPKNDVEPAVKKRRVRKVHPDRQPPSDYESEYAFEDPEEECIDVDDLDGEEIETEPEDDDEDIMSTSRTSDDAPGPDGPAAVEVQNVDSELVQPQVIRAEPVKQPLNLEALDARYELEQKLRKSATPAKAVPQILRYIGIHPADVSGEKATQLLQCLTALQEMVKDPSMKGIMAGLSSQFPILGGGDIDEAGAARGGAPSSSKPGARGAPVAPKPDAPQASIRKPAAEAGSVKRKITFEDAVDTPSPEVKVPEVKVEQGVKEENEDPPERDSDVAVNGEEKEINSSTHRKEHARLTRRMANIDAAQAKIDCIVRRGDGIPDEDAPQDPESVRFWAFTTGHYKELEKISLTGTATTNVKPTVDGVTSLLDTQTMPSACATSSSAGGSTLSLTSLVDVMKDSVNGAAPTTTPGPGRAKAKAKAKAKARAVEPQTMKEKREAARKELKKEMSNCSVLFDLPKTHELRTKLSDMKGELEALFDKLPAYQKKVSN